MSETFNQKSQLFLICLNLKPARMFLLYQKTYSPVMAAQNLKELRVYPSNLLSNLENWQMKLSPHRLLHYSSRVTVAIASFAWQSKPKFVAFHRVVLMVTPPIRNHTFARPRATSP